MLRMSEGKKKPGRKPKSNRSGKPLHMWIDQTLRDALDAYLGGLDPAPSLTSFVESAIRHRLTQLGGWPPKPPVPPADGAIPS